MQSLGKLEFEERMNKLKNNSTRKRIIYPIAASVLLFICFLLCRYCFFNLHGMKDWPVILFTFGLIVIIVSALFNSRKVMICTPIGYIMGFVLGMLFNTDSLDPGGGILNNAWIIWTTSFLMLIIIGVVLEVVTKRIKKKK